MENKTNKPYSLQDAKDEISKGNGYNTFAYMCEQYSRVNKLLPEQIIDQLVELYASKATEELRRNICEHLAVMHADGGHHTAEVGIHKSIEDASEKYYKLHSEIERLKESNKQLEDNRLADDMKMHDLYAKIRTLEESNKSKDEQIDMLINDGKNSNSFIDQSTDRLLIYEEYNKKLESIISDLVEFVKPGTVNGPEIMQIISKIRR